MGLTVGFVSQLNHIPEEMMEEYEGPLFGDEELEVGITNLLSLCPV